jgi:hypothetical protein
MDRYRKIVYNYCDRYDIHFVFYLCSKASLIQKILKAMEKQSVIIHYCFGLLDDFLKNPKRAVFVTNKGRRFRLGLVLKRPDGQWPVKPIIKTQDWYGCKYKIQTMDGSKPVLL